jgi:hypothetical protein
MKNLIPNVSKLKGIEPPKRDTMYVSSKNDPRLKSYQDSTRLSKINTIPKGAYNIKKYKPEISAGLVGNIGNLESFSSKNSKDIFAKDKIKPYRQYNTRTNYPAYYFNGQYIPAQKNVEITGFEYKKPVQPVAYRPEPKVTTDTRKIQMETTKLDTVPIIKTPPTPLTKKQYYEVPDANGKNVLLTPEQFSRMSSGNKNDLMSKSPIMNKPKYFYEMNNSGKRQLIPENKIREYMQSKNK